MPKKGEESNKYKSDQSQHYALWLLFSFKGPLFILTQFLQTEIAGRSVGMGGGRDGKRRVVLPKDDPVIPESQALSLTLLFVVHFWPKLSR
jgi:hypothetical protein